MQAVEYEKKDLSIFQMAPSDNSRELRPNTGQRASLYRYTLCVYILVYDVIQGKQGMLDSRSTPLAKEPMKEACDCWHLLIEASISALPSNSTVYVCELPLTVLPSF